MHYDIILNKTKITTLFYIIYNLYYKGENLKMTSMCLMFKNHIIITRFLNIYTERVAVVRFCIN